MKRLNLNQRISEAKKEMNKGGISVEKLMETLNKICSEEYSEEYHEEYSEVNLANIVSKINLIKDKKKCTKGKIYKSLNKKKSDDERFVWLKLASDKSNQLYLGVVAYGKDFNYFLKNTSGKIISALNLTWDVTKIIVIEFYSGVSNKEKKVAEKIIGNLLQKKGVSIIDAQSHKY